MHAAGPHALASRPLLRQSGHDTAALDGLELVNAP
jgi:hypothetical protein